MQKRKNTLNNIMLENNRKNPIYQSVITDLCLEGALPREKAEALLGYEIPPYLKGATGASLQAKDSSGKRKQEAKAADVKASREGASPPPQEEKAAPPRPAGSKEG